MIALFYTSLFIRQSSSACRFGKESWVVLSPIEQRIKEKIEAVGTPLKDWNVSIYRGVLTGYNEAFIINGAKKTELIAADPKSAEIIRPILRGRDIKRYGYDFADLWLITTFPSLKIDIEQFPAIKAHLLSFGYDRLKQTGERGARKKTNHQWFETQDSINYWEDFYKQKIVWAETMRIRRENTERFPRFSYIAEQFFTDKTCFMAVGFDIKCLLAILNSTIGRYQFSQTVSMMDNGGYLMQKIYVEQIKICKLDNQVKKQIIALVDSLLKSPDERITENFECQIDAIIFNYFGILDDEQQYLKEMLSEPLGKR